MALTYGFYNSIDGDRKYDAVQLSSLFDGLIIDGIFATIGTAFNVTATSGITVSVGEGKAWFNHTWTVNDSELLLDAPLADPLLNRIDAVVLEVNSIESVRANSIKFVKGTAATDAERPTLTNDTFTHQYPLCYIERAAGSTEITQSEITPMIGSDEAPFVVAMLETISLEELLGKWQDELDDWVAAQEKELNEWFTTKKDEMTAEQKALKEWIENEENGYTTWLTTMKAQITSDLQAEKDALDEWISTEETKFTTWFDGIKKRLGDDNATSLQTQIDKETVNQILLMGFTDGTKTFSEDGLTINAQNAAGTRTLVKTFSSDFLTMTVDYTESSTGISAQLVKKFSADGKTISSTITYAGI